MYTIVPVTTLPTPALVPTPPLIETASDDSMRCAAPGGAPPAPATRGAGTFLLAHLQGPCLGLRRARLPRPSCGVGVRRRAAHPRRLRERDPRDATFPPALTTRARCGGGHSAPPPRRPSAARAGGGAAHPPVATPVATRHSCPPVPPRRAFSRRRVPIDDSIRGRTPETHAHTAGRARTRVRAPSHDPTALPPPPSHHRPPTAASHPPARAVPRAGTRHRGTAAGAAPPRPPLPPLTTRHLLLHTTSALFSVDSAYAGPPYRARGWRGERGRASGCKTRRARRGGGVGVGGRRGRATG